MIFKRGHVSSVNIVERLTHYKYMGVGGMNKKIVVDMFCGAGGESTGITQACNEMGYKYELFAINHWERAIETHSVNYPEAYHFCESIQNLDPLKVIKKGRVNLLWASPECTHHSNARGGRPRNNQSRATAWLVLKWLSDLYVDRVIIENVPEFLNWGPLGTNGQLLKSGKGETFSAFINAIKSLGYRVDWRILCAADYGDPTTRERLFIQAVRGKKRIQWPEPTHFQSESLFELKRWIPARKIIDWNISGESIFNRKKELSENTLKRIEAGIQRYWGKYKEPFLVKLRGTSESHIKSSAFMIEKPLPTVTTAGNHFGLVEPFMVIARGQSKVRAISDPVPTVTSSGAGHIGLIEPFIIQYYGNGDARSINNPLDTVTTKDRFALINGEICDFDIRFRMLQPHELAAAQGFPKDYILTGNKTEQVKQIGNAVPVNTARALCLNLLKGEAA